MARTGKRQEKVLGALLDARDAGERLLPRELRERIGTRDRPNTRRAVRRLIERGLVEQDGEGRLSLAFWGAVMAYFRLRHEPEPDPWEESRRSLREIEEHYRRRKEELLAEAEERRRRIAAWKEPAPPWTRRESVAVRYRYPGPVQRRVIRVLLDYADPEDLGLPVAAVKALVGGDPANARRAIRSMLDRGELEETADGENVRLSYEAFSRHTLPFRPFIEEPIDPDYAHEVLHSYGATREQREAALEALEGPLEGPLEGLLEGVA